MGSIIGFSLSRSGTPGNDGRLLRVICPGAGRGSFIGATSFIDLSGMFSRGSRVGHSGASMRSFGAVIFSLLSVSSITSGIAFGRSRSVSQTRSKVVVLRRKAIYLQIIAEPAIISKFGEEVAGLIFTSTSLVINFGTNIRQKSIVSCINL